MLGTPKYTLHYFPFMARGHAIRILLHHAKIPFIDHLIPIAEWATYKTSDKCEFLQVPVFQVEDKLYPQQRAILRYLGRNHGFYPELAEGQIEVDILMDSLEDYYIKSYTYIKGKMRETPGWEEESIPQLKNWMEFLAIMEKRLEKNDPGSKYLVGEKLSIADFMFISYMKGLNLNPNAEALYVDWKTKYPKVDAYAQSLLAVLDTAIKLSIDYYF